MFCDAVEGVTVRGCQGQRTDAVLLDTVILNEVFGEKNAAAVRRASGYLQAHGQFGFLVCFPQGCMDFFAGAGTRSTSWRQANDGREPTGCLDPGGPTLA